MGYTEVVDIEEILERPGYGKGNILRVRRDFNKKRYLENLLHDETVGAALCPVS